MNSGPRPDLSAYLGRTVRVVIDRPLGTAHPRHPDIVYPLNYGFLPGTVSGDGHPIDAYVLGPATPIAGATGRVVAVVLRANDAEDKLIVATDGARRTPDELAAAVAFQERFFDSRVLVAASPLYTEGRMSALPYKLAAIDLDDTLLGPDKLIGAANHAAVRSLIDAGVYVILASGRRHENMRQFHRRLDLPGGLIVSCNGAQVKDEHTGEILHQSLLPADAAAEIIDEGDRRGVTQNYYHTNGHLYVRELDRWTDLYQSRTGSELDAVGDLARFEGDRPLKIIWVGDPRETEGYLLPEMRERFGERLYITTTDPEYLEFMQSGVNKAAGLMVAAERLGVSPAEVIAFGDGNNDVEMLRWAGLGVAMSHGRHSAKAAADVVAPPGDPESDLARAVAMLLEGAGRGAAV